MPLRTKNCARWPLRSRTAGWKTSGSAACPTARCRARQQRHLQLELRRRPGRCVGQCRALGKCPVAYRLVLTQRQLPLVAVTGQANCLREWTANEGASCTAGELSTPGMGALEPLHEGVAWVVSKLQPSWKTLRVRLSPILRTNVGSEVGALDYSVGINAGLELPLWSGAFVEWRQTSPSPTAATTSTPASSAIAASNRKPSAWPSPRCCAFPWMLGWHRAMTQKPRWGLAGVTAQATVGRIGSHFDGG